MKMVVADNLEPHIDDSFVQPGSFNTSTSWLLVYMVPAQTYCDFAGC
jgi:D-alanyl-lipoteichoic acid acyltransferase DltB (MBOAT superfamily)